jgi:ABC-type transport system involved in Fe-S cluster assembly fused permease/ATPase subunit
VLEAGYVREKGTHGELMAKQGLYTKLLQAQQ